MSGTCSVAVVGDDRCGDLFGRRGPADVACEDTAGGGALDGELQLLTSVADRKLPENREDVSTATLIPAFVLSELKDAFIIGFIVFIPFLVIDIVVSGALMSLGMMMMPPVMVSLPFKLLLFVMVDGWALIIRALVSSYGGGP